MKKDISKDQNTEQTTPKRKRQRKKSLRYHKLIRRIHLYLGLFLVPWIFLYGVTAILFNHGDWFTSRSDYALSPSEQLILPAANQIAKDALEKIENKDLTLVPDSSQWIGSISFRGKDTENNLRLQIHPSGQGGKLRISPISEEQPTWAKDIKEWSPISDQNKQELEKSANTLVNEIDSNHPKLSLHRYPKLRFRVQENNKTHTITLKLNGSIDVAPGLGQASVRRKLMRLHVLHGDPGYIGLKWLWSLIVDIMGIAMILWGITGLVMWWTIRATRKQGQMVLIIGFSLIIFLAIGLWHLLGMS